jgi:biotin synthase
MSKIEALLEKVYSENPCQSEDLEYLLALEEKKDMVSLFAFADKVRKQFMRDGIILRGIIEFSNFCRNSCFYCGLNRNNKTLSRYRLSKEEILDSARQLCSCGIKTIVLQSGEDDALDAYWLAEVIKEIKSALAIAITLSVGERDKEDYRIWREAGADRYLLKIEATDQRLYESLHPGMSFRNRLKCLQELRGLEYQVGSGNIVGLKGQTIKDIAADILFFQAGEFDMLGIGPFIPHGKTELGNQKPADANLTLKTLALTRIVTKNTHLPATTALGSLERDFRPQGLTAGANVLMPNFTPWPYRGLYEIYPGKRCLDEAVTSCPGCMEKIAESLGRFIDYSRGDSLKINREAIINV